MCYYTDHIFQRDFVLAKSSLIYSCINRLNRKVETKKMTPKARLGNKKRVNKWRGRNKEKYREYMREYMRKLRSTNRSEDV